MAATDGSNLNGLNKMNGKNELNFESDIHLDEEDVSKKNWFKCVSTKPFIALLFNLDHLSLTLTLEAQLVGHQKKEYLLLLLMIFWKGVRMKRTALSFKVRFFSDTR